MAAQSSGTRLRRSPASLSTIAGFFALLVAAPVGAAVPAGPVRLDDVRLHDPTIRVKLSYSHPRNAFGRQFYRCPVALLRPSVARRLAVAQRRLRKQGMSLVVWDAYRTPAVQWALYRAKPGTRYLVNPRKGSKHSRGAAVDVTLAGPDGRPLPMPTPHDEFSARARPGATRGVSPAARRNARILAQAMRGAGFIANAYEWWHFSAPEANQYPLIHLPPRAIRIRSIDELKTARRNPREASAFSERRAVRIRFPMPESLLALFLRIESYSPSSCRMP